MQISQKLEKSTRTKNLNLIVFHKIFHCCDTYSLLVFVRHPDDKLFFNGPCDAGINEYYPDLTALTAISVNLTTRCNSWYGTR